jgi:hypothetical protein
MKSALRYAFYDLGEQPEGSTVVVRLSGSRANVLLLDESNFFRYRVGQQFSYVGGHYSRSPVRLRVPQGGHWYAVLDLGGFAGRVRGAVSVHAPDEAEHQPEATLVEAS